MEINRIESLEEISKMSIFYNTSSHESQSNSVIEFTKLGLALEKDRDFVS